VLFKHSLPRRSRKRQRTFCLLGVVASASNLLGLPPGLWTRPQDSCLRRERAQVAGNGWPARTCWLAQRAVSMQRRSPRPARCRCTCRGPHRARARPSSFRMACGAISSRRGSEGLTGHLWNTWVMTRARRRRHLSLRWLSTGATPLRNKPTASAGDDIMPSPTMISRPRPPPAVAVKATAFDQTLAKTLPPAARGVPRVTPLAGTPSSTSPPRSWPLPRDAASWADHCEPIFYWIWAGLC